ncbi:hypothetical protein TNIN_8151 [Trichonephila inaurata madagascariensis]|uniref:Uncharacterized protein n=1 Tax=Trichonephila inaurata madagascariensis TaxID=2747483 RepID=A0A8X6YDB6_9ARAC|nr:hypothetical protein TNIN_8151 [Trichonephila inaurata madagascariensis]
MFCGIINFPPPPQNSQNYNKFFTAGNKEKPVKTVGKKLFVKRWVKNEGKKGLLLLMGTLAEAGFFLRRRARGDSQNVDTGKSFGVGDFSKLYLWEQNQAP